jgi:hypothetical protein
LCSRSKYAFKTFFILTENFSIDEAKKEGIADATVSSASTTPTPKAIPSVPDTPKKEPQEPLKVDPEVEKKVLMVLCDINLDIPCNAAIIADHTTKALERGVTLASIEVLLQNFASQQLIRWDLIFK